MYLILCDNSEMEIFGYLAYLKTHRAIVICVKCIEQEMCICRSIYREKKQTHELKNIRCDYSSISTISNTSCKQVNSSKESFRAFLNNFKEIMLFFHDKRRNKMLGAKSFLIASCVVSHYSYCSCLSSLSDQRYQSDLMFSLLFLRWNFCMMMRANGE